MLQECTIVSGYNTCLKRFWMFLLQAIEITLLAGPKNTIPSLTFCINHPAKSKTTLRSLIFPSFSHIKTRSRALHASNIIWHRVLRSSTENIVATRQTYLPYANMFTFRLVARFISFSRLCVAYHIIALVRKILMKNSFQMCYKARGFHSAGESKI